MYFIAMTLVSFVLITIGAQHVDGGYLYVGALVAGGVYLGHVLTEALNNPTHSVDK
jgi:hypothetical protein